MKTPTCAPAHVRAALRVVQCVFVTVGPGDCIKNALQFHPEDAQHQLSAILHAAYVMTQQDPDLEVPIGVVFGLCLV